MRITASKFGMKNASKKIKDLKEWMSDPIVKSNYNQAVKNIKAKWQRDVLKTFTVRSSKGLFCDNLLANALGIEIKKDSVIIYVKPISRAGKQPYFSSGGAVNNLTSILFHGSKVSAGMYSYKWDARVRDGIHPGTSPSLMRTLWKRFNQYSNDQFIKKMREGLDKARKKP